MTLVEIALDIPVNPRDFPDVLKYRMSILATAHKAGLDIARLEAYRVAVQAGFFTDYPEEN